MKSLILEYQKRLGDPHLIMCDYPNVKLLDFKLREAIGKTEDIKVARASHNVVRSIEAGERFCRVCGKDLQVVGEARVNDYLVLRHKYCKAPICLDCSRNRPDAFHKAYKAGLVRYMEQDIWGKEVESEL